MIKNREYLSEHDRRIPGEGEFCESFFLEGAAGQVLYVSA